MTYPASNAEGLFPDFAELDQTVKLMEEHQKQIIEDFNRIFRRVCEEAEKAQVSETAEEAAEAEQSDTDMPLTQFLAEFGESLFDAVTEQNRPVYHGQTYPELEEVLDGLARPLFTAQREVVRAVLQQLVEEEKPAAIINAEMGTGKTMMSIAAAAAAHRAGLHRTLVLSPPLFEEEEISPKEADVLEVVKEALAKGRKCLVYTVYTDTRDTTGRLKEIFKRHGIKAAVMKATVKADQREDWVEDRLAEGVQVVICNPELVKTGLDLLAFPTIYFMQTGYNVYTLMQAARRSWRIGQKEDVEVYFAGYSDTAQQICLELMGRKIAVTQSTSGDMPDSGLDILNQVEDSIEVELAKRLIAKHN